MRPPLGRRRSNFVTAFVAVMALLLVSGCGGTGGGKATVPAEERTLTIGATAYPSTLDPSVNDAAAIPQALLYNVYETLVRIDQDGHQQRLLASDFSISPDRLTYTFQLRSGAKFASGSPVDANAVVTSMEYIKNDAATSPTLKKQLDVVDSVKAVDQATVEFVLKHPSSNWLYDMAGTAGIIYDPAAIQAKTLGEKPAGSGPYVFEEYRQGESLTLKRNSSYWGTPVRIAGATFRYFADSNAMNTAMLSGQLDVVSNVAAPQALSQFSDTSMYTTLEGTTNGEIVLGMNHQRPALQDVKVRQAINYGIDRKALRDAVWAGKGDLIGSMVPPTDPWYEDLSGAYPYDPAKAKALLAESGHANGLTLKLRVPTLPYATGAATYIASQLSQIGITVEVEQLEFPARWIDEVMIQSNYDMTIVAHVEGRDMGRFADQSYYWHYNNAQFNELIAQADVASESERDDLMKQAAKILSDDAAADFLWLLPNLIVTKADVVGIAPNATSLSFDLTSVAIKGS